MKAMNLYKFNEDPKSSGGKLESKSLLFQKTYFESIIENLPEGVAIFDENGRITCINAAFTAMFGYTSDEAVGRNISDLVAPPAKIEEAHGIRLSISKGKTISRETVRRHKDGTDLNVAMKSAAVTVDGNVAGYFVVYRDITAEKLAESRLIQMATTDSLTGLYNRRHFFDLSEREFARSRRNGSSLVVLMIDIDHFKNINDTYGHQAGDDVLKELAELGSTCLRSMDIFGRIGGEEFAVLLPETISDNGVAVAERFRNRIERMQFETIQGALDITVSIGVASALAGKPDFDKVLAEADMALYNAKCEGRNRVSIGRGRTGLEPGPTSGSISTIIEKNECGISPSD